MKAFRKRKQSLRRQPFNLRNGVELKEGSDHSLKGTTTNGYISFKILQDEAIKNCPSE